MDARFEELASEAQVAALLPTAHQLLAQYDLSRVTTVESINHEYNSTFRVETKAGKKFALRININSTRNLKNLSAEIWWMRQIKSVKVPKPVTNVNGEFSTSVVFEPLGRELQAALFEWLPGSEVGDEPTSSQLRAMGEAMAKLHLEADGLELPASAELPSLRDFFWGEADLLASPTENVSQEAVTYIAVAKAQITKVIDGLYSTHTPQLVHADMHGWNVMWHQGEVAIFDFDDCGMGLRHQDLSTAIYYLDTDEQDAEFIAGYESVTPLPSGFGEALPALLIQHRLQLLNYIVGSSNLEHRQMVPKYRAETLKRIEIFRESRGNKPQTVAFCTRTLEC